MLRIRPPVANVDATIHVPPEATILVPDSESETSTGRRNKPRDSNIFGDGHIMDMKTTYRNSYEWKTAEQVKPIVPTDNNVLLAASSINLPACPADKDTAPHQQPVSCMLPGLFLENEENTSSVKNYFEKTGR